MLLGHTFCVASSILSPEQASIAEDFGKGAESPCTTNSEDDLRSPEELGVIVIIFVFFVDLRIFFSHTIIFIFVVSVACWSEG